MDTRRDFLKKAALLSGSAGLSGVLPESVLKAMAINPATGTTYLDAEHIVILMQENRSFDHTYGTLQGVRGYNDPRAILQPDKNLVWLQKNAEGETYAPFRLNIKETNSTWLGSLPHSWTNQQDAHNGGKHDKWLIAKPSGHKGFAKVPLTMGYYNREDIPFYYSLADAFTVCDQNFCSSLTGTTPNRLHLWTGTVRPEPNAESFANLRNEDVDYYLPANWPTFPEKLEDNGISWRIYQNELSLPSGLNSDEDAWLANFGDNPIEWFSQYNVFFAANWQNFIKKQIAVLPAEIDALNEKIKSIAPGTDDYTKVQHELDEKKLSLDRAKEGAEKYSPENYSKLSQREKNLHEKAFDINKNDPYYRELETLQYIDDATIREMKIPKGDVLNQFRKDVDTGNLPTVSWIVSPENFSDHPGAPWYGAWYVAEVMDILTKKPEVWKKTIFILCYDENDGYFDHVPPFVAPDPNDKASGLVSKDIDASVEFVTLEQDMKKYQGVHARKGPIGLGFRVPLVIASPWSRGGAVCSEVFDHTSIIQFIEHFVNKKFNKKIKETNISQWRRTVCGNLTSVFKPYNGEEISKLSFKPKDAFLESIHNAKFKKDPFGYKVLSDTEITIVNKKIKDNGILPVQEKGIRPACAIAYELYADGQLSDDKKNVAFKFSTGKEIFGEQSAGSPFQVYAHVNDDVKVRSYTVSAGDTINDEWQLNDFGNKNYHFNLYGPNGFYRELKGNTSDPLINISVVYHRDKVNINKLSGNIEIIADCKDSIHPYTITIIDNAYKSGTRTIKLNTGNTKSKTTAVIDLSKSFGWYDFTITITGHQYFSKRYAGHIETGKQSFTDPLMGGMV